VRQEDISVKDGEEILEVFGAMKKRLAPVITMMADRRVISLGDFRCIVSANDLNSYHLS
jgi:hypothetical protein